MKRGLLRFWRMKHQNEVLFSSYCGEKLPLVCHTAPLLFNKKTDGHKIGLIATIAYDPSLSIVPILVLSRTKGSVPAFSKTLERRIFYEFHLRLCSEVE